VITGAHLVYLWSSHVDPCCGTDTDSGVVCCILWWEPLQHLCGGCCWAPHINQVPPISRSHRRPPLGLSGSLLTRHQALPGQHLLTATKACCTRQQQQHHLTQTSTKLETAASLNSSCHHIQVLCHHTLTATAARAHLDLHSSCCCHDGHCSRCCRHTACRHVRCWDHHCLTLQAHATRCRCGAAAVGAGPAMPGQAHVQNAARAEWWCDGARAEAS